MAGNDPPDNTARGRHPEVANNRELLQKETIMANITQLGYLGLSIGDVNEWERFATHILGLQVSGQDDDGALLLRQEAVAAHR